DFILKSQNYLEKLPLAVVNAYHKYKFEESVIQSSEAHNHAESNEKRFQERTIELISTIEDKEKLLQDLQIRDERYRAYFENSFESISRFELLEPVEITLPLDQIIEKIYSYSVLKEYNKAFLQTHNLIPIENLNEIKIGMILPKVSSDNFNILKNFVQNNFKIQNAITKELSSDGTYKIFLTNLFGVVEENKLIRIWSTKREITDLKKAEEEIIKLNQELEKRVEERTRDLELANKELESFSYSVSHDLRAPLRAIIGYSNIIQEDYQENLIPPVKELFESIVKNAKYMGRLIDDLLRLSRVTQHEIIKSQINMKELFNKCLNEADISKYNIIIGDLPPVAGDKSLIEIAINNLINNAIKFSNTQENPTIEISATENENEVIYSIKDNGVGFNMDYADKMFVAFQRLHSSDKFEGTGIGLSIVQRIINKHGGKIWAEGKENEGATFYFSLPKK
ncbi:MAG: ATP-binding protein, partial [Melioribacteraceae bacterium]|nr:ATP-binding protein [Melioribacteraceae bacterium]